MGQPSQATIIDLYLHLTEGVITPPIQIISIQQSLRSLSLRSQAFKAALALNVAQLICLQFLQKPVIFFLKNVTCISQILILANINHILLMLFS